MLSDRMNAALNGQLNAELYSGYLYLAMAAYFKQLNLAGFARWMEAQALEEQSHAMKFYAYIDERGGRIELTSIDAPPSKWDSPRAVFEAVLAHERKVTGLINDLVNLAIEQQDHATNNFLQWFVGEQVEEEAGADEVLQKVKPAGDAPGGLLMLDKELGARTFMLPPGTTLITLA